MALRRSRVRIPLGPQNVRGAKCECQIVPHPVPRTNRLSTARVLSHLPESQGHRVRALATAPAECVRNRLQRRTHKGPTRLSAPRGAVCRGQAGKSASCGRPVTRYRDPKRSDSPPASRVVPRSNPSSLILDGGFLFKFVENLLFGRDI